MKLAVLFRFYSNHRGRVQHMHAGGSPESAAEHHRRIPVPGQLCRKELDGEEHNLCELRSLMAPMHRHVDMDNSTSIHKCQKLIFQLQVYNNHTHEKRYRNRCEITRLLMFCCRCSFICACVLSVFSLPDSYGSPRCPAAVPVQYPASTGRW